MDLSAIDDDFSWYAGHALETAKTALMNSFPLVPFFSTGVSGILYFYLPQLLDESLDDPDADTFRVIKEREEQLADLLIKRRIKLHGVEGREELEKTIQNAFKKVYIRSLRSSSEIIERLNEKHGIAAKFFVEISEEKQTQIAPYGAVGGSFYSSPAILYETPWVELVIPKDFTQEMAENLNIPERSLQEREFFITHEFSHIAHEDMLSRIAIKATSAVLGLLPWMVAWSSPISWGGYLIYAASRSCAIHAISELFFSAVCRGQEKRADLEAIEQLGTNQGAIECFSSLISDFSHPTKEERLQYAKEWKPKQA